MIPFMGKERRTATEEPRELWTPAARIELLRIEACLLNIHAALDELARLLVAAVELRTQITYRRWPRPRLRDVHA